MAKGKTPDNFKDNGPPKLHLVPRKPGKKMTVAEWGVLQKLYIQGDRSPTGLARATGFSIDQIEKAVHEGFTRPKLPPLKIQAEAHDKARDEAAVGLANRQAEQEANDFGRIKRAQIRAGDFMLNNGLALAVIGRRLTHDAGGNILPNVPADNARLAGELFSRAQHIVKGSGDISMRWVMGAAPEDVGEKDQLAHMTKLTEEQCAHMVENPGRLPPGITPEMWEQMKAANQAAKG